MKANELRIGNLVDFNGEILPIHSINGDNTVRLLKDGESIGCFSAKGLRAVPITEKWLLKLGFVENQEIKQRWHHLNIHYLTYYLDDYELQVGNCMVGEFPYVHDIQNMLLGLKKKVNDLTPSNHEPQS